MSSENMQDVNRLMVIYRKTPGFLSSRTDCSLKKFTVAVFCLWLALDFLSLSKLSGLLLYFNNTILGLKLGGVGLNLLSRLNPISPIS